MITSDSIQESGKMILRVMREIDRMRGKTEFGMDIITKFAKFLLNEVNDDFSMEFFNSVFKEIGYKFTNINEVKNKILEFAQKFQIIGTVDDEVISELKDFCKKLHVAVCAAS